MPADEVQKSLKCSHNTCVKDFGMITGFLRCQPFNVRTDVQDYTPSYTVVWGGGRDDMVEGRRGMVWWKEGEGWCGGRKERDGVVEGGRGGRNRGREGEEGQR